MPYTCRMFTTIITVHITYLCFPKAFRMCCFSWLFDSPVRCTDTVIPVPTDAEREDRGAGEVSGLTACPLTSRGRARIGPLTLPPHGRRVAFSFGVSQPLTSTWVRVPQFLLRARRSASFALWHTLHVGLHPERSKRMLHVGDPDALKEPSGWLGDENG